MNSDKIKEIKLALRTYSTVLNDAFISASLIDRGKNELVFKLKNELNFVVNEVVENIITHGFRRANDEYCDWDETLVVPGDTYKVYLYYTVDDDDQIICEKCIYEDVND